MLQITIGALLCCAAAAANNGLRSEGFVRTLEFKHQLRVCNAFPFGSSLDVFRGKGEKLTESSPMPYKACRDFSAPLKTGDKLEFKIGDATAGTFAVADLPNNDAVLLLVVHRHDTLSTAVSFESHVFANLANPQIVVLDTYRGKTKAHTTIMDADSNEKQPHKEEARSEELRFDSVVAVNPGMYEVTLAGDDGEVKAKSSLVALNHVSYVVFRSGVEAAHGQAYAQELVVYPQSDAAALHSYAASSQFSLALLAAAVAAGLRW